VVQLQGNNFYVPRSFQFSIKPVTDLMYSKREALEDAFRTGRIYIPLLQSSGTDFLVENRFPGGVQHLENFVAKTATSKVSTVASAMNA
jgi:hypothetical protein